MTRNLLTSLLIIAFVACGVLAQLPDEDIRQGEARQQHIKTQTQQVARQLDSIIQEFKRNGLDGQDVAVLEAIRNVLSKLSDQEMKRVIGLLQEARSSGDTGSSRRAFVGAVTDQKTIVVQMRQLLIEYQRQQALHDIAIRLGALAERQNSNLKAVVELAKAVNFKTGANFDDSQRASLQVQQAEQQAIRDEVNPLLAKLADLSKEADGTTRERLNLAMKSAETGGLKPAMDRAIEDLKAANLLGAAGSEKTVRDQLRDLARAVAPPKDTLAALRQAAQQLEKAIESQKQLTEETAKADKRDKEAPEKLEVKQADLVDKTDLLRKDVENLAPEAAAELRNATDEMQDARSDLQDKSTQKAIEDQKEALAKMESARQALEKAIANAEPKSDSDKLAAARELQQRTRELIKQEEGLKAETAAKENKRDELRQRAPKQESVEAQTRDLQRDTAQQVPEAAQPMGDAAAQMDRAEKNLTRPEPRPAQEAQAAAISSLKQADETLGKEIARLEEAEKGLNELLASREKIRKLIEEQAKVELSTAKGAALIDAGKKPQAAADKPAQDAGTTDPASLAGKQGNLATDAEKVRSELLDNEKAADQPMAEAVRKMADARAKLDAKDLKAAHPAQQEALVNLYKALEALDRQIADLQNELGQPAQDPQAMATAAEAIEQLKQDVQEATDLLGKSPEDLLKKMEQQQRQIAKELGQMAQANPQNESVNRAQQAAQNAASQLAQNNLPQAAQAMDQAQKNMEQAMEQGAQPAPQQGKQGEQAAQQGEAQAAQQGEQAPSQQGQQQAQQQGQQGEQGQQAPPQAGQQQNQQGQPAGQQGQPAGQQQGQQGQNAPQQAGQQQGQQAPPEGLPGLAQQQQDLKKQLDAMIAGQQTNGNQQAAQEFGEATQQAGDLAAGEMGALPQGAAAAMQQAASALSEATAASAAGNQPAAEAAAAEAQAALAQASASMALAQAGLGSQPAQGQGQGQQGEGQGQGQAQAQGQGQGQGQGKGQGQGQGQGEGQGQGKGKGEGQAKGKGTGDRESIQGGKYGEGQRVDAKSAGKFVGLPERDRAALIQSQNEKYPESYAPQIEQYLRNLSESEGR